MIYFLRTDDGSRVKIGYTRDGRTLLSRIETLQYQHQCTLHLMRAIDGERWTESWLHQQFLDQRISGEWFHVTAAMETIQPPATRPEGFRVLGPRPRINPERPLTSTERVRRTRAAAASYQCALEGAVIDYDDNVKTEEDHAAWLIRHAATIARARAARGTAATTTED